MCDLLFDSMWSKTKQLSRAETPQAVGMCMSAPGPASSSRDTATSDND